MIPRPDGADGEGTSERAPFPRITLLPDAPPIPINAALGPTDPAAIILTCANCGAAMDERKCKLTCRCGYFLSCSDYY